LKIVRGGTLNTMRGQPNYLLIEIVLRIKFQSFEPLAYFRIAYIEQGIRKNQNGSFAYNCLAWILWI